MSDADRQRMDFLRSTAGWHVQRVGWWASSVGAAHVRVASTPGLKQSCAATACAATLQMAELASGRRAASPTKRAEPLVAAPSLRPIREPAAPTLLPCTQLGMHGGGTARPAPHQQPRTHPAAGTTSVGGELSPRQQGPPYQGFVESVLDQVGDEAAVYSPLARGASALSDHTWPAGGDGGTPRSGGSLAPDASGAPRSPWWAAPLACWRSVLACSRAGS